MNQIVLSFLLSIIPLQIMLGHTPDHITYQIHLEDHTGYLTIHFTPQNILDLMDTYSPQMTNRAIINLEDCQATLVSYFNKHIKFQINHTPINFQFIQSNFNTHDATLSFKFNAPPLHFINHLNIEILSFTELYNDVLNLVKLEVGSIFDTRLLDNQNRYFQLDLKASTTSHTHPPVSLKFGWISIVIIIGIALLWKKSHF